MDYHELIWTIRWFKSYLENRKQYVDVNGGISGMRKINYGVFQGSCGGPLLFIVFFNDIMELQDDQTMILGYADDNNYKITLDFAANEVEEYMNANRLKFNASKTQLMIMTPKKMSEQHVRVGIQWTKNHIRKES